MLRPGNKATYSILIKSKNKNKNKITKTSKKVKFTNEVESLYLKEV